MWIAVEGSIFHSVAAQDQEVRPMLTNVLSFEANPSRTPGYSRFAALWRTLTPANCSHGPFAPHESAFARAPNVYAAYAYDAAAALSLALQSSSDPHDSSQVLASIEALQFDGVTGAVAFDALRDRAMQGQMYSLSLFVLSSGGNELKMETVRLIAANTSTEVQPIVWLGGGTEVPTDKKAQSERQRLELEELERNLQIWGRAAAALLVALFLATAFGAYWRGAEKKRRENAQRMATKAIDGLQQLDHPCVLIPAATFVELGRLVSHESLRNDNKLHYFDSPGSLKESHVIFFSHQWTAFKEPDPTGKQFEVMVAALRHVVSAQNWEMENVFVWVDLSSIPQAIRRVQLLAIQSLANYAAAANAFIICAPEVVHADTHKKCDLHTYNRRMWCRLEQLCHMLRKGTAGMWVATSPTDCTPLAAQASGLRTGKDWILQMLRVFQGDVTVERDKHDIVLPILGLYAELYATHVARGSSSAFSWRERSQVGQNSDRPSRRPHLTRGQSSGTLENVLKAGADSFVSGETSVDVAKSQRQAMADAILGEITRHKTEIFPPSMPSTTQSMLWRRYAMRLPLVGPLFEAKETLFGILVEEVERKVDKGVDHFGEGLIHSIQEGSFHRMLERAAKEEESSKRRVRQSGFYERTSSRRGSRASRRRSLRGRNSASGDLGTHDEEAAQGGVGTSSHTPASPAFSYSLTQTLSGKAREEDERRGRMEEAADEAVSVEQVRATVSFSRRARPAACTHVSAVPVDVELVQSSAVDVSGVVH